MREKNEEIPRTEHNAVELILNAVFAGSYTAAKYPQRNLTEKSKGKLV